MSIYIYTQQLSNHIILVLTHCHHIRTEFLSLVWLSCAAVAPWLSFHLMLTLVHRHCDNDSHRQVSNLCHYSSDVTLLFKWMFRWFSFHLHVLRPSFHAHVSFAVIGCGWLQALRVAGVHLITAKRGGQAHPPQTSPLNIFMYQVGLLISSSPYSQSQNIFFSLFFS